MDNKGFTLVEVIVVVALLGLIIGIAVPGVIKSSQKAKERTLNTKIENIEKAAVLYGQDHREMISYKIDNSNNTIYKKNYKYCFKSDGNVIQNCYYYRNGILQPNGSTVYKYYITVSELADAGYIKYDDETNKKIFNTTDESKNLNECQIKIYKKYNKIYAVYQKNDVGSSKCWI